MSSRRRRGGEQFDPFASQETDPRAVDALIFGGTGGALDDDLNRVDRERIIVRPVTLDEIEVDPEIQVRVGGLDEETVEKYTQILLNGGEFKDPIDLFRREEDTRRSLIADGFHRREATERALKLAEEGQQIAPLKARIHPGGKPAAIEFAEDANLKHGKALSTADRREIFERRLKRNHPWKLLSDREIAKALGVSHQTVGRWRAEIDSISTGPFGPVESLSADNEVGGPNGPRDLRRGADGKIRDISKIRQSNAQRQPKPKQHYVDNDADPAWQDDVPMREYDADGEVAPLPDERSARPAGPVRGVRGVPDSYDADKEGAILLVSQIGNADLRCTDAIRNHMRFKSIDSLAVLDSVRLVEVDMELAQLADLLGTFWDHIEVLRNNIRIMITGEENSSDEPR